MRPSQDSREDGPHAAAVLTFTLQVSAQLSSAGQPVACSEAQHILDKSAMMMAWVGLTVGSWPPKAGLLRQLCSMAEACTKGGVARLPFVNRLLMAVPAEVSRPNWPSAEGLRSASMKPETFRLPEHFLLFKVLAIGSLGWLAVKGMPDEDRRPQQSANTGVQRAAVSGLETLGAAWPAANWSRHAAVSSAPHWTCACLGSWQQLQ